MYTPMELPDEPSMFTHTHPSPAASLSPTASPCTRTTAPSSARLTRVKTPTRVSTTTSLSAVSALPRLESDS